jgi:hypothetical protein
VPTSSPTVMTMKSRTEACESFCVTRGMTDAQMNSSMSAKTKKAQGAASGLLLRLRFYCF